MRKTFLGVLVFMSQLIFAQGIEVISTQALKLDGQGAFLPKISPKGDYILVTGDDMSGLRKFDLATGELSTITNDRSAGFNAQFAGDGSENSPSSGVPFFFRYDVLSGGLGQNSVGAPYDIIISNPPYVCESEKKMMRPNVLDHEPGLALFVPDENPLLFYAKIADSAAKSLKHGGKLYFEINEKFPEQVVRLMEKYGFGRVEASNDLYGKPRFVKGVLEQA